MSAMPPSGKIGEGLVTSSATWPSVTVRARREKEPEGATGLSVQSLAVPDPWVVSGSGQGGSPLH